MTKFRGIITLNISIRMIVIYRLSLTNGRLYKGCKSLVSLPIAHKRTYPLAAPDATRSLLLQTVIELTHEYAEEEPYFSDVRSSFSAWWNPKTSYNSKC